MVNSKVCDKLLCKLVHDSFLLKFELFVFIR